MRLRTDGKHAWRADAIERAVGRYDCNRTTAIMHAVRMDREL